ncbi:serine protease [Streptomyces caelestis]|uniref:Serine protease n=1 Tax=Streptomyces caelestis TaxID=36816 RepID=A0A0M9X9U8_9ACTN|nr:MULTISPECIES: SSI family serine proteinase inhibitor [Streptomyces]KOT41302.1 serine protease [Streptomyces caelestis]KOV33632.1 serine protease [Streptomyces sp. XY152]
MTHISVKAVRAGLVTALVLLACAAPARAGGGHVAEDSWLMLTVSRGETPSTRQDGTLLRCDPPRGHRRAADACAELTAVDGRIADLPAKDVVCPMVFAPVTAHASGRWRGRPVDYTETFPNTCLLTARTGAVFALDTQ